jgi:hypothetical protein
MSHPNKHYIKNYIVDKSIIVLNSANYITWMDFKCKFSNINVYAVEHDGSKESEILEIEQQLLKLLNFSFHLLLHVEYFII